MPGLTIRIDASQFNAANRQMRQELGQTRKELKIVHNEAKAMQNRLGDMAKAQAEIESLVKSMGKATAQGNLLKKAMGGALAVFSVGKLMDIGQALLDTALATDRLSKAYYAIEGSTAGANQQLEFIRETSERLGLEFLTTAEAAKTFFASAQGTTLESDVNRIFEAFSKAGTAMALSGEQMQGVFLALGQMIGKGKVQAEELRGQIGERLPGAFQIAAKAMGMTTAELDKFMADGKLTAEELLPRMADELENRFAGAAEEAASGLQASVNRMMTAWNELKAELADSEFLASAIDAVTASLKKAKDAASLRFDSSTFSEGMKLVKEGRIAFDEFMGASALERQKMVDDVLKAKAAFDKVEASRVQAIQRRAEEAEKAANREAEAERKARAQIDEYLEGSAKNRQERERQMYQATLANIDALIAKYKAAGLDPAELLTLRNETMTEYQRRSAKVTGKKSTSSTSAESNAVAVATQKAQLLQQIGEMSGNIQMSEQAQLELITQQANEMRQSLGPALQSVINEWERLAKLNATTDGFLSQEMQVKRLKTTWKDYYTSVMDWGSQLGNTMTNAFNGMEDAFVQFTMTGRLSFSDMVNSMIADLTRLMVRQSITGPLANAIGQGIGGLFAPSTANSVLGGPTPAGTDVVVGLGWHSGGLVGKDNPTFLRTVPSSLFADAPRFHGGTGYIKPGEYPAILKAGERVLSPAETRDYQRGGDTNVSVVIHNSTGQQATTKTRSDNHGNKTIDVFVGDMAAKQMATPGTTLNRAVSAQTGTRRPAIKR